MTDLAQPRHDWTLAEVEALFKLDNGVADLR